MLRSACGGGSERVGTVALVRLTQEVGNDQRLATDTKSSTSPPALFVCRGPQPLNWSRVCGAFPIRSSGQNWGQRSRFPPNATNFPRQFSCKSKLPVNAAVGRGTSACFSPKKLVLRHPNASPEPEGYFFMVCGMNVHSVLDFGRPAD